MVPLWEDEIWHIALEVRGAMLHFDTLKPMTVKECQNLLKAHSNRPLDAVHIYAKTVDNKVAELIVCSPPTGKRHIEVTTDGLMPSYLRTMAGVVAVYAPCRERAFEALRKWPVDILSQA